SDLPRVLRRGSTHEAVRIWKGLVEGGPNASRLAERRAQVDGRVFATHVARWVNAIPRARTTAARHRIGVAGDQTAQPDIAKFGGDGVRLLVNRRRDFGRRQKWAVTSHRRRLCANGRAPRCRRGMALGLPELSDGWGCFRRSQRLECVQVDTVWFRFVLRLTGLGAR